MWRVSKATISGINPSSELMMANAWNVSFKISLEKKNYIENFKRLEIWSV